MRTLQVTLCVATIMVLLSSSVGCSVSPKPEPPGPDVTIDPGGLVTYVTLGPREIKGGPGCASPAGAVVRAFNLELTDDPAQAVVEEDGSFTIELDATEGDEVRLQVVAGESRSDPLDIVVGPSESPPLLAARALDCLVLEPPLEIDTALSQTVQVTNQCEFAVTIEAPYVRRAVTGLTLGQGGPWPALLSPTTGLPVAVQFDAAAGTLEEIVFIEASAPEQDRRPITVLPRAP